MLDILNGIKESGNYFFSAGDYVKAARKYRKAQRYLLNFLGKLSREERELRDALNAFNLLNCLNQAAVAIKLDDHVDAKYCCNEVRRFVRWK